MAEPDPNQYHEAEDLWGWLPARNALSHLLTNHVTATDPGSLPVHLEVHRPRPLKGGPPRSRTIQWLKVLALAEWILARLLRHCLLYTSPSPRDLH